MGWVTGAQDLFTADFTAVITTVATDDDGINWYNWAMLAPVSDGSGSYGNGLYDLLDDGPSGTYSSDVDDNTAMREMNNALLTIPEGGLVVRARVCGESDGGILFTFSVAATPGATNGYEQLAEDYTCTSSFADVGLSVDLPGAGTYVVAATVTGYILVGTLVTQAGMTAQLYDSTNALAIGPPILVVQNYFNGGLGASDTFVGSGSVTFLYTITAPATIQLQAAAQATDGTVTGTIAASTGITTAITWFRIA